MEGRDRWNARVNSPEQMTLEDIVMEKYAVIHAFATLKMSVPGRAFWMYEMATEPTARRPRKVTLSTVFTS